MLPIEMLANAVTPQATPVVAPARAAPAAPQQGAIPVQSQVASDFVRSFLSGLGSIGAGAPGQAPSRQTAPAQPTQQDPGLISQDAIQNLRPPSQQTQGAPNAEMIGALLRLLLGVR